MKTKIFSLVVITGCVLLANASVQANDSEVVNASAARLAGLQVQWYSQIQADATRDRLVDADLHVHDDQAVTYYEIRYDNQIERIGIDDLNNRGEPYGQAGAQDWVGIRKEILEAEGKTVDVQLVAVPKTTLYAMTDSGVVHALDAETGSTLWTSLVGKRLHPGYGLAANNQYVVAVKGSQAHCLNSDDGQLVWTRPIRSSPGGGIALSDQFAYLTTFGGFLQAIPLNETGIPVQYFIGTGRAISDPLITSNTVSWPSERGFYYVARNDRVESIDFRLKTASRILAPGAAAGDLLIVNSLAGKVYALDQQQASIAWEYAIGERLWEGPVTVGNEILLIISEENNLFPVNPQTGMPLENWPQQVSGIRRYVGSSEDLLYFIDDRRNLIALRRATGNRVSSLPVGEQNLVIQNNKTDRLYIGSEAGSLMCLSEIGSVRPFLHGDEIKKAMQQPVNPFDVSAGDATQPQADSNADAGQQADKPAGGNPFDKK